MRVLITDGNFKHTLAAVRSLGRRGIEVTSLSHLPLSLSSHSRYCTRQIRAPNPEKDPSFAQFVLDLVQRESFDVLLPISFAAVMQLSAIREDLERYVHTPLPAASALAIAGSKDRTMELAEEIGVPLPRTYYPQGEDDLKAIGDAVSFPVVVKGSEESGYVGYANSQKELIEQYRKIQRYSPIVQEYITGDGYGFFALYNHGSPRAIFMHRRIREYPVTGGPSSCAESVYDPHLRDLGLRMLDALDWHGVAMVEFKKDQRTGEYVLMEINPKFWGSLGISIAAGVDFPYLTCRLLMDGDIEPVETYRIGLRYRWVFPQDLFHAMTNPSAIPVFLKDFFDSAIQTDFDLRDPIPNVLQIGQTGAELVLRLSQGRFWRPHGAPQV